MFEHTYQSKASHVALSGKEPTWQCRRSKVVLSLGEEGSRKWQPAPEFLPGKSHGQSSLAGYSPRGPQKVEHRLSTAQQSMTQQSSIQTML